MLHSELTAREPDRGESLVELLIALAIIGITVAALIAALITAITSSSVHRSLTNLDTILRSNAEELKYEIELKPSPWFQDGASMTTNTYAGNPIAFSFPAGYGVSISAWGYWNSTTSQFDPTYVSPQDTTGYQLITLKATGPSGDTETLSFGVRSAT